MLNVHVIESFECDAEAIVCGETYDVKLISGPNHDGLYVIDVPFDGGSFIERMAVIKENVFPKTESAVSLLMSN